jgi:hypothetical protein
MEGQQLVSPSRQCSSTQVGFVKDFLAKDNLITLEHSPYSPDLAQPNLYPFPRLESALKGRRCCDHNGITKNAMEQPKRRAKNGFQESFQQLYSSWQKRIVAKGEYFEGNVG